MQIPTESGSELNANQHLQFAEKGYLDVPTDTSRGFDSDFEESVADFISRCGFQVHPQVGMAGFFIDIGVIDPSNETRYILGVECDGATYHSSRSARDRDRLRQQILESRGWRIYRIWSTDWFHRRKEAEARLLEALESARISYGNNDDTTDDVAETAEDEADNQGYLEEHETHPAEPLSVPYVEAAFRLSRDDAPHTAPVDVIADALRHIVQIEGPIHQEEIARRLATVWGLERAGSRIQEAAKTGLKYCQRKGWLSADSKFWSVADAGPPVVRDRSAVNSLTLRKPAYLAPSEIMAAAESVVDECVRIDLDDLVVEVARRFGFQRTGSDLQSAIAGAIRRQFGQDIHLTDDGMVMRVLAGNGSRS